MTIIVFLVDTSASMNQRAYVNGRKTLLDISKEAVEWFVKQRQKSAESRGDRYMLLTFDEFPKNIKAGWKENLATFMTELKNLEAAGMTTMGSALKAVFDTLNINRMQSGIDMYGQGRYPYYLEPAVIVIVTDGGRLTTANSVQRGLELPMSGSAGLGLMVPGGELTREPFRWDQRLYALVLRMAGHPPMSGVGESGHVASDNSPVDAMCEVTGGRSYAVTSARVLHQCIESLVQKLQSGVVINFEKIGSDPPPLLPGMMEDDSPEINNKPTDLESKALVFRDSTGSRPHTPNPVLTPTNTSWHKCRKLIYVQRSAQKGFAVGFWPLPEAFWPDVNAPSLPQRSANPTLLFTCTNQEPMIIDNLPFDKYELEPSPLTLFILARKQPNYCWQVFIQGSNKNSDTGHPFGYLKASTNLLTVNLFVLPYNYPMLLPLLDDLFKAHRLKPTNEWRAQFCNYLRTMPTYYAGPLRRALTRMGAGNLATGLIPESMDSSLSYSVLNYLKRLKNQAKMDYDKIVSITPFKGKVGVEGIKVIARSPLKRELVENPVSRDAAPALRDQLTDFPGLMLGLPEKQAAESHPLRNPFDIPRSALLDQVVRMRANFLGSRSGGTRLVDEDTRHSLPISQMGNYQDYLKKQPVPLREIESAPVRQHMFGNPFKFNKSILMMDEVSGIGGVDEVQLVSPSGGVGRGVKRTADQIVAPAAPPKRRKGALPKDFEYVSPRSSPCPSPSPHTVQTPHDKEVVVVAVREASGNAVRESSPLPRVPAVNGVKPMYPSGKMGEPIYPSGKMNSFRQQESVEILDPTAESPLVIIEEVKRAAKKAEERKAIGGGNHKLPSRPKNNKNSLTLKLDNKVTKCSDNNKLDMSLSPLASLSPDIVKSPTSPISPPVISLIDSPPSPVKPPSYTPPLPLHTIKANGAPPPQHPDKADLDSSPVSLPLPLPLVKPTKEDTPPPAPVITPLLPLAPAPTSTLPVSQPPLEVLTPEELRSIRLRNNNARQLIYKEVKRPGKKHDQLWQMLAQLHGPPWIRKQFIIEVRLEAIRFKRRDLADQLQSRCDKLSKSGTGELEL